LKTIFERRLIGNHTSRSAPFYAPLFCLPGRLYLFAAICALEAVVEIGVIHIRYAFRPGLLPVAMVSFAAFLGLGNRWLKAQRERLPFGFIYFGGHLACVAAAIGISAAAELPGASARFCSAAPFAVFAAFLLQIPLLALACVPFRAWTIFFRSTGSLWFYALLAGLAAWFLIHPFQSLWSARDGGLGRAMQMATFDSAQAVLGGILPDFTADAASFSMGTPRFSVTILEPCSGMEGMGLMLAFSLVWFWCIRKQLRFPRAFLLIPCALGCMWGMNVLRICALILIGNAFGPDVAMVGFHSYFGWIAFTAVALVFCLVAEKISWLHKRPSAAFWGQGGPPSGGWEPAAVAMEAKYSGESPAIRGYLIPFLAILAASFVSKAASGYFEWLYPLRFVAAAVAICCFWPWLKKLDWRFGWVGPAAGVAVFLVWIAPTLCSHQFAASRLGPSLASLSPVARWTWIAFRVAAAVTTVPLAEELAFRGYLARRFVRWDFDSVPFTGLTALSIALSSAAFGLMHGRQWLAGILAGLAYALALRWRGRMGDAVVAHAVTNLLLAVWVLGLGDWAQW
jgi:exosortase E/protease (VPEID-CTERM system)